MAVLNLFNFTPVVKLYFALNGFLSLVFVASCIKKLGFGPLEVVLRLGEIGLEALNFLRLCLGSLIRTSQLLTELLLLSGQICVLLA